MREEYAVTSGQVVLSRCTLRTGAMTAARMHARIGRDVAVWHQPAHGHPTLVAIGVGNALLELHDTDRDVQAASEQPESTFDLAELEAAERRCVQGGSIRSA